MTTQPGDDTAAGKATYAELAALTADLPAGLAQPPKAARASGKGGQPVLRPGQTITGASVLYAGVWVYALFFPYGGDGSVKPGLVFLGGLVYLCVLAVVLAAAAENRRDKPSGGQLPRGQAPPAGGEASPDLPPAGPGQAASPGRSRSPAYRPCGADRPPPPAVQLAREPAMAQPPDQTPAAAGRGHLRTTHADREHAIEMLKAAYVQGMLTKDEFDLRVSQAFASRTYADLAGLTADLPARLTTAKPLPKPARARGEQKVLRPGRWIAVSTAAYAGAWAYELFLSPHGGDNPSFPLLILGGFLIYLGILIVSVGAIIVSWRDKHPGGALDCLADSW